MRRTGVVALLVVVFAVGVATAAFGAGGTLPFATTTAPAVPVTTIAATTTAPGTTTAAVTTTTTATTTTATAVPGAAVVEPVGRRLPRNCTSAGGLAIVLPAKTVLSLGPIAESPAAGEAGSGKVAYPADGSVVIAAGIGLQASGCGDRTGAGALASVRSVSLFGGAVTVGSAAVRVTRGAIAGVQAAGLTIAGAPIAPAPGRRLPVEDWGYAVVDDTSVAPLAAAALGVHLTAAHAGLPAGSVLVVSFASLPVPHAAPPRKKAASPAVHSKPARTTEEPRTQTQGATHGRGPAATTRTVKKARKAKTKRKRHTKTFEPGDRPLTVTPPLQGKHYVFPVAGQSDFIDTYGGFRGDVPGNWHHGDDIFAPLGTPVVAVADGTLNRVGWERLGGWRLWVRDRYRNEFYYAHLSGYSPRALHSKRVKAGEVIGYIGNTGDAFTTSPHLHFEIHPVSLLALDYGGAVDPTSYLQSWQAAPRGHVPRPVHPPFPRGAVRSEARYVWRELLAVRGLAKHAPPASQRPRIRIPSADNPVPPAPHSVRRQAVAAVAPPRDPERSWLALLTLLPLAGSGAVGAAALVRQRRGRTEREP